LFVDERFGIGLGLGFAAARSVVTSGWMEKIEEKREKGLAVGSRAREIWGGGN
jgi:hypothetical protein